MVIANAHALRVAQVATPVLPLEQVQRLVRNEVLDAADEAALGSALAHLDECRGHRVEEFLPEAGIIQSRIGETRVVVPQPSVRRYCANGEKRAPKWEERPVGRVGR